MNAKVRVERPDGTIETVETKMRYITDETFAQMKKATAEAGRGILLSYDNGSNESAEKYIANHAMSNRQHWAQVHAEENRKSGICPKCGTYCDGDCK
jgi:hypothetical protein